MAPRLSVIVLQYNKPDLTRACLRSFLKSCGPGHEIILVDNASTAAGAGEVANEFPGIRFLLRQENGGFSAGNNDGARLASGEILLFLNNDTVATSDFVSPALEFFSSHPSAAVVGPKLLNPDGSVQLSSGRLPSIVQELCDKWFYAAVDAGNRVAVKLAGRRYRRTHRTGWVSGAAMFVSAGLFRALGGFDESFFMFFEDKDLCMRAQHAGREVWYVADASLVHLRGASANAVTGRQYRQSQLRFYEKNRHAIQQALLRTYLKRRGLNPDDAHL